MGSGIGDGGGLGRILELRSLVFWRMVCVVVVAVEVLLLKREEQRRLRLKGQLKYHL